MMEEGRLGMFLRMDVLRNPGETDAEYMTRAEKKFIDLFPWLAFTTQMLKEQGVEMYGVRTDGIVEAATQLLLSQEAVGG